MFLHKHMEAITGPYGTFNPEAVAGEPRLFLRFDRRLWTVSCRFYQRHREPSVEEGAQIWHGWFWKLLLWKIDRSNQWEVFRANCRGFQCGMYFLTVTNRKKHINELISVKQYFMQPIDQLTVCNVTGDACSKLNRQLSPTLQGPSALQSSLALFSSLFWF